MTTTPNIYDLLCRALDAEDATATRAFVAEAVSVLEHLQDDLCTCGAWPHSYGCRSLAKTPVDVARSITELESLRVAAALALAGPARW